MKLFFFVVSVSAAVSGRIVNVENPDGSYTVGLNSDSAGETGNTVLALLLKSAGYTLDENFESSDTDVPNPQHVSGGLLRPHLEILQLIETFLKFKGEVSSRMGALVTDNWDLLRSVYLTTVGKIGTLHSFTLTGIRILRRILEFALTLFGQWQINLPQVSFDLNVANQASSQGLGLHVSKNANFYNNH